MRKIATTHGVSYAALVAGAAWISLAGGPVSAQEAAPAVAAAHDAGVQQPSASSDDIVVTARRRSEPLQRVPLAVSVIQAETLSSNGIDSIADLPLVAPTLTSTPSPGGGRSSPNFAIRGLSQQELSILGDQSVSAYVGDVVIARVQGVNGALYDIGSIEVLRGPQGTLFGRNTTGGAVVIRPNRPTDRFEGKIGVSLGSFGTFNTEAMLNLPIGDSASLRIAGRTLHDDGYVYDQLLSRNVNFTKQFAGRVQLLLKPGSRFESLTSYEIFHENDGGVGAYLDQVNGAAANNAPAFRAARGYRPLETLLAEQRSRDI